MAYFLRNMTATDFFYKINISNAASCFVKITFKELLIFARNNFYGGDWATFSVRNLIEWLGKRSVRILIAIIPQGCKNQIVSSYHDRCSSFSSFLSIFVVNSMHLTS